MHRLMYTMACSHLVLGAYCQGVMPQDGALVSLACGAAAGFYVGLGAHIESKGRA